MKPLLPDTYIGARILLIGTAIVGWLMFVFHLHGVYWNPKGLPGRRGAKLKRERIRVVLQAVCLAGFLVTAFLAFFASPIAAGFVGVVATLIVLVVFSAYGHGADEDDSGNHPRANWDECTKLK